MDGAGQAVVIATVAHGEADDLLATPGRPATGPARARRAVALDSMVGYRAVADRRAWYGEMDSK
jgi:hypothetical protein